MTTTRSALIALTAALTLGITACGSSDDSGAKGDSKSSSASEKSGGGGSDKDGSGKNGSGKNGSGQGGSGKNGSGQGKNGGSGAGGAGSKELKAISAAIDAAEKETGGTVYEADTEDGGTVDVDVAKGSKTIDAEVTKDGKVTVDDDKDDRDDASDRAVLKKAKITLADALEAALKETDGTPEGAELEEEKGKGFWEVTVGEREVAIDASTGKVLTDVGGDTDDDNDDD